MSITIKTRLNEGIYKSEGGGETRTHYEWATGPRNLAKAVDQFFKHRDETLRNYGNIGCGASWMEIDGKRIDRMDLNDLRNGDNPRDFDATYPRQLIKSRTAKCREFIEYVRSGRYEADKAATSAYIERNFA